MLKHWHSPAINGDRHKASKHKPEMVGESDKWQVQSSNDTFRNIYQKIHMRLIGGVLKTVLTMGRCRIKTLTNLIALSDFSKVLVEPIESVFKFHKWKITSTTRRCDNRQQKSTGKMVILTAWPCPRARAGGKLAVAVYSGPSLSPRGTPLM